jgi:hypothetical protein
MNKIFKRKILYIMIAIAALLSNNPVFAIDYSITAGNWKAEFKSNETLYTSVDWTAPESSSHAEYFMIWIKKDPGETSRASSLFLFDYGLNSASSNKAWMEEYVSSLISGFNSSPSISEYLIDGQQALIAEGWSNQFEKFTYAAMYPFDPTKDNTAQKFVGFASNLDKETSFEILDSLHVEYNNTMQNSQESLTNNWIYSNEAQKTYQSAQSNSNTTQVMGTRENPVPMGTTVDLGDGWQITVISVIPDATNDVLNENQFNDPPNTGNQFFIARIKAKYTGSGSDTFGGSYRLRSVGPSSVGYSTFENSPGVIPDPLPDSEVFSGGEIEGNVGWEIKSSDAYSLVMYDNPISFGDSNERIYMALYGGKIGSSYSSASSTLSGDQEWASRGEGRMGRPAT